MNVNVFVLARRVAVLVVFFCASALMAQEARDPFWPIGFDPNPPPPPEKKVEKLRIVKPDMPAGKAAVKTALKPEAENAVVEVSPAEWRTARKTVKPSGFWKSGAEYKMMFNRKIYAQGDELVVTNNQIRFTWRVDVLEKNKTVLKEVNAVRLRRW